MGDRDRAHEGTLGGSTPVSLPFLPRTKLVSAGWCGWPGPFLFRAAAAHRLGLAAARICDSVWRAVIASGSSFSSITDGLLLLKAWRKAGAKSCVVSIVWPSAPKLRA